MKESDLLQSKYERLCIEYKKLRTKYRELKESPQAENQAGSCHTSGTVSPGGAATAGDSGSDREVLESVNKLKESLSSKETRIYQLERSCEELRSHNAYLTKQNHLLESKLKECCSKDHGDVDKHISAHSIHHTELTERVILDCLESQENNLVEKELQLPKDNCTSSKDSPGTSIVPVACCISTQTDGATTKCVEVQTLGGWPSQSEMSTDIAFGFGTMERDKKVTFTISSSSGSDLVAELHPSGSKATDLAVTQDIFGPPINSVDTHEEPPAAVSSNTPEKDGCGENKQSPESLISEFTAALKEWCLAVDSAEQKVYMDKACESLAHHIAELERQVCELSLQCQLERKRRLMEKPDTNNSEQPGLDVKSPSTKDELSEMQVDWMEQRICAMVVQTQYFAARCALLEDEIRCLVPRVICLAREACDRHSESLQSRGLLKQTQNELELTKINALQKANEVALHVASLTEELQAYRGSGVTHSTKKNSLFNVLKR